MFVFRIIILVLVLLPMGCAQQKQESKQAHWPKRMQAAAQAMNDILPLIYNEKKFKNKSEFRKAERKIAKFAKTIHSIPVEQAKATLGDDPYVLANLAQLKDLASRAHSSFRNEGFDHARVLLKASVNSCFKCHTRTQFGPETYHWKNFNVDALNADNLEKSQLHIALRQYKQARASIKKYIEAKESSGDYGTSYENGIKYYLIVALRGEESVDEARRFVSHTLKASKFPPRMEGDLKAWLHDLVYWSSHSKSLTPTLKTVEKLLEKSKTSIPQGIMSGKNLVNNLLASSLMHKVLMGKPSKKQKAKIYYYLGHIYNSIIVAGFWDLPETYFEMCIYYSPQSNLAKKCFNEYRDNIVLGYSGSSGTLIPHFEYKKLEKLRAQAGAK